MNGFFGQNRMQRKKNEKIIAKKQKNAFKYAHFLLLYSKIILGYFGVDKVRGT